MHRRAFLTTCRNAALLGAVAPRSFPAPFVRRRADYTIRIAQVRHELAPGKIVETTAYNDSIPGPLIRTIEGQSIAINVVNESRDAELVHWHGFVLPSNIDGAMEEGTPMIPAHGRARYELTPRPPGFRWYHAHGPAGHDLHRSTYSGQFGCFMVDARDNPARYDQEVFLALHDWNAYHSGGDDGYQMVKYNDSSINGRLLGHDEPVRVRSGERVLFHILNASATDAHWLSLPMHRFNVTALDGNLVPTPSSVEAVRLGPGERVDAIVTMNAPGVWILGESRERIRRAGMGVVVEYANQSGSPAWKDPAALTWDYTVFGRDDATDLSDVERVPLAFRSEFHGHGDFEHWSINGKSYPDVPPIRVVEGKRYLLVFQNQSDDDHPVHLHRHSVELRSVAGRPTSDVMKDVVIVTARTTMEVLVIANAPGDSLFHCHQQDHMDAGFMTMLRYV